jgi:hypothetical protein
MAKRRLKTMDDVRRLLADTTNLLCADQIDAQKAGKIGFLANILARVIEAGELEKRLTALEAQVAGKERL